MDLLLRSPQLFIYSSIPPCSSPARLFNPAGTNREIKKLKMRSDESGSQRAAGYGQVQRADVQVRGFLINTRPLLHFLEHDAVFCGGKTL